MLKMQEQFSARRPIGPRRSGLGAALAPRAASRPRLVADAVAGVVARRRPIIEAPRLMIARTARLTALAAARSTILRSARIVPARRPVFVGDRITESVRLHARFTGARLARTAAGSLALTLPAAASAGGAETAGSGAAARWAAALVAARWP